MSQTIKTVHLVFKTHLDLGFTDLARNVLQRYMEVFIPNAIQLARLLREGDKPHRFIWTTGAWLIYRYLEQADSENRHLMEAAILAGDIRWHALPFTLHSELLDADLFRFGLSYSQKLDARFGRRTIAAKMTDVPGHTRGIVPLLAEAGVELLHIGVNEASPMPQVPPVFLWHDEASDTAVTVIYEGSYGSTTILDGIDEALSITMTGDNMGPPTVEMVETRYRDLETEFTGAKVEASSLDAFAIALHPLRPALPVVMSEIGDTWIHGVGTDPLKVSRYRELLRLRSQWQGFTPNDRFNEALLLVAEHTWGLDSKLYLHDHTHYSAEEFQLARGLPNFRQMEQSWAEQRQYVDNAVAALEATPFYEQAVAAISQLTPKLPDLTGYQQIEAGQRISTPRFALSFDPLTGAITHLHDQQTDRFWADTAHPLALLRYQTFSQADYDRYWMAYIRNRDRADVRAWAFDDYTKPGIDGKAVTSFVEPRLLALYHQSSDRHDRFIAELGYEAPYGAPQSAYLSVIIPHDSAQITLEVSWLQKPASRLPEALWVSFVPIQQDRSQWELVKLGTAIAPHDVVQGGNRFLHAVEHVAYRDDDYNIRFESLDAPLVAPGKPSLLEFPAEPPDMTGGIHFNLWNNLWGTNFPLWFDEPARFRFTITF